MTSTDALQWLTQQTSIQLAWSQNLFNASMLASAEGKVHVLDFLASHGNPPDGHGNKRFTFPEHWHVQAAAAAGQLESLGWLKNKFPGQISMQNRR